MNERYMIDTNKLYAWYRITCQLSKQATEAIMLGLDYSQPVIITEKPQLGLSLVDQQGYKAILPDQVLSLVSE